MSTSAISKTTQAFYIQAGLSFVIAVCAMTLGVVYLPVDPWMRAFLAMGSLYLITSTFTLAKCVRDVQEAGQLSALDPFQLQR